MVEILDSPYQQHDVIPMVEAVIIDDELSYDHYVPQPPLVYEVSTTSTMSSNSFEDEDHRSQQWGQPEQDRESLYSRQSNIDRRWETTLSSSRSSSSSSSQIHQERGEENEEIKRGEEFDRQRKVGAGAAGAFVGLFFGGPIGAIVLGIVTMSYTSESGAAGDIARGLGEVAIVTKDKAIEVNNKHHLVDKSKIVAANVVDQLKKQRTKHRRNQHLRHQTIFVVRWCYKQIADFARRHNLVERGKVQFKILVDKLAANLTRELQRENHQDEHHLMAAQTN